DRRRREERDLSPAERPRPPGEGDHHDLLRAPRNPENEPPDRRDVRGSHPRRARRRRSDAGKDHDLRDDADDGDRATTSGMKTGPAALIQTRRVRLVRSDAVQRLLAFGALILIIVVFSLASPNFLQFDNVVGILLATTVTGALALGVTFVIITGGIDLSIGTLMTLSAVVTGTFATVWHLPLPLAVVAGLATGALAGLVNCMLLAQLKIPSFIATLGMLNVAKGLALVIS